MIRKISIGLDIKQAMHYIVGKPILDNRYTVHLIKSNGDYIDIYVEDSFKAVFLWKSVSITTPHTLEYSLDFE